jgi:hypothetical protein
MLGVLVVLENIMPQNKSNHRNHLITAALIILSLAAFAPADTPQRSVSAADGLTVSVKMIGPVTQSTDLQIICVLKHDPAGDKYIEAMQDLNSKLHGLISSLRDRGEFAGDRGETLLLTPPPDSISAKQLLLIGVGPENDLSLDTLALVGRIAAREAVRLHATNPSFAPALRDQGSTRIDVGDGDAAIAQQFVFALDTQARLAAQQLGEASAVKEFVIEAGPKFFDSASEKVTAAIDAADSAIKTRNADPYLQSSK